jgi:hypothetical protein
MSDVGSIFCNQVFGTIFFPGTGFGGGDAEQFVLGGIIDKFTPLDRNRPGTPFGG